MHGMVWTVQQCLEHVLVQSYSRKADHRPDLMRGKIGLWVKWTWARQGKSSQVMLRKVTYCIYFSGYFDWSEDVMPPTCASTHPSRIPVLYYTVR